MRPICPKCSGWLRHHPADILGPERITCGCGYYLERRPEPVEIAPRREKGQRLDEAEKSEMAALAGQGKSCIEIAAETGRSRETVRKALVERGGNDGTIRPGTAVGETGAGIRPEPGTPAVQAGRQAGRISSSLPEPQYSREVMQIYATVCKRLGRTP